MTGSANLYAHSASVADSNATPPIVNGVVAGVMDTRGCDSIAVDLNVVSFTAGTTPNITFFVDRLGADNQWYQVWTSGALSAAGIVSVDIGRFGMTYAAGSVTAQHAILTTTTRLRWVFGGGVAPTAVTWSGSVVGRG